MRCPACQHAPPADAEFCPECGAKLALACAACGAPNPRTHKFCAKCGARLGAAPPAPEAPAARPAPAYTPKHLAEKVLTSRSAIEGERKQVTVLFCDIVDSTRIAERLDPEVMHEIMDRALRLMAEAVHRYEGTVNQFLGDGIMALFGAPVALEDHAVRGVQAALTIQETLRGYSEQLRRDRGVEIHLRMGLHTGLVVVGRIGDDLRMDYTAVGDTTNLAARMQSLAEPGTILVTEAVHRPVEGYVRCEPLGPVQVKGRSEAVVAYRVVGRRRWRTRLEVSAERGLTPLVGRQRELDLLHECFRRARSGRGQVVGIVGEAGSGKSRIAHEFRRSLLAAEPIPWLESRCVGYGQATPYLPILELLRHAFQIDEEDNPFQVAAKLLAGVQELDPALEGALPFLGDLFGLPADEALRHMDPHLKRRRTFEAIRALTVAGGRRGPVAVLVVEDLHWIDRISEDYLAYLIDGMADVPVLLLTTHRPGYALRWANKTYYTQVGLDVLTEPESRVMLAQLLGTEDLPADLLPIVSAKAEGNPLFVEEITRSLLERGILMKRNGGARWAGAAGVDLPGTIQDIIRARIDHLEEPVKRTMQTASAIGREFSLGLLARISEKGVEVQTFLDRLKHVDLIHEKRFFPELEYLFKHAVVQDVAYQTLLVKRRQELHGAIARAIEELYADRLEEEAALLAYHYARSEEPSGAIAPALRAGDRAARLHAHAEAKTYYQQALALAQALPVAPEAQRTQIDATLKLASVGQTRQDTERDQKNLERAQALAEALQDEPRLAQTVYWRGRIHYVLGNFPAAIEYAQRSLAIADPLGDDSLAAPPVNLLGRVTWLQGDYGPASQLLVRSAEQMGRIGNATEEATAAGFAGWALGFLGELMQGLAYAERALQLAQQQHNPFAEAAAYMYRGAIHDQRGDWAQAIADYEEARGLAEQAGDVFRVYLVKCLEGRAHAMGGAPARGRVILEDCLTLARQLGTTFVLAWPKAYLAACLLALGEYEAAKALCQEAIQLAEAAEDKYGQSIAHRTLAAVLGHVEPADPARADEAMGKAIRLQAAIGARPELARSYLSYARLLQRRGDLAQAKAYLGQALDLFQKMHMAWDQAQAESALRALS